MAAGPATQVTDIVVPDVFTPYVQQLTTEKSRLIQSGVVVSNPLLNEFLSGGGLTVQVPSFRDLDADDTNGADRVSTDDSVPFAAADASIPAGQARPPNPQKIQTAKEIAVRMNRNNSWSSADLAAQLAGADPMAAIGGRVATYWERRLQRIFVSSMNGIFADNAAAPSGTDTHIANDMTNDISAGSFVDGVTNFSAEAFIDATLTMGDSMEELVAMMVHSVVYARMQKNNLIDFIPDASGQINIPTFLGREVLVDDGMPVTASVYDTWLFGTAAVQIGDVDPPDATETDRKPGGGNGGGQSVLYSRRQWSMHPTGHAYIQGSIPDGGPTNANLAAATSWSRVYPERKQIKIARLVSREA